MTNQEIDHKNEVSWNSRRADLQNAFEVSNHLLGAATNLLYVKGMADANKTLGYCYWRFSDYTTSLQFSLKAIELYRQLEDKKGEADALNSVGAVYMFQNEHQKRLDCNLKCLEIRKEIGDLEGVAGSLNNIGETYFEMGDLVNANRWFEDCLAHPSSTEQIKGWANHNLGKLKHSEKDWQEAERFYQECLRLTSLVSYEVLTNETFVQLTKLYLDTNDLANAETQAGNSLELANKTGSKEAIKSSYLLLSQIKEAQNDFKGAHLYYKKFHEVNEQIFNEESAQKLKDIAFQYELDKVEKEAEIERLKSVELKSAYDEIELQKEMLENKNKEVIDSIRYARRIQDALLKDEEYVTKHLPPHFIIFKPKDIVSGDFYWFLEKDHFLYIAAADCTGHGVPGAFLTMLGTSYLNEIMSGEGYPQPAKVLEELRSKIVNELSKNGEARDGMDISLLRVNLDTLAAEWSGAMNPLWMVREGEEDVVIYQGDKQPIGFEENMVGFSNTQLQLRKGDKCYLFSDGYSDQFGGEKGKKLKQIRFKEFLLRIREVGIVDQRQLIDKYFETWKGDLEQVDDVCVIGVQF